MTKTYTNRILLIYNILLSASIIIAGTCLIFGCLNIYYSGNGYSRELVTQVFSKICIPVYICLGLIIGSFIINLVIPTAHKPNQLKQYDQILCNLIKSRDTSQCDDTLKKFNKNKLCFKIGNIFIITLSSIYFLIYAINPKHYHQTEINHSIISAMWVLLPLLVLCFTSSIISYYGILRLTKKQIEILKTLPKKETVATVVISNDKTILIVKIVIVAAAVGVLIFGAVTGGFADVLTKAANICTECIGLG